MYISYKKIKNIITEKFDGPVQPANIPNHKATKVLSEVNEAYEAHISDLSVFVTICRRWGEEESHTYLRGIFRTLEGAVADSLEHYQERGGKYYPEIYKDSFNGSPELVFDYGKYEKSVLAIRNPEKIIVTEDNFGELLVKSANEALELSKKEDLEDHEFGELLLEAAEKEEKK